MINNEKVRDIVGLLIGIVTVPMAISTLQWSNTTSDSITAAINVVNTYAFYQGKAVRQSVAQVSIDDLELQLKVAPPEKEEHRVLVQERIANLKTAVAAYSSDAVSGEGKKELLEKAKQLETEQIQKSKSSTYYGNAMILLQLSLVLASTALTVRKGFLLIPAGLFLALGLFILVDAAAMFFPIPF